MRPGRAVSPTSTPSRPPAATRVVPVAEGGDRDHLLGELRFAVAFARLVQSGDRLLGSGVSQAWRDAHSRSCELLDRCEAAGISEAELDAVIAEGATS